MKTPKPRTSNLFVVKPDNPSGNIAEHFVIETARCIGDLFYRNEAISIVPDQRDDILDLYIRDIRHINHHLVHADSAEDRRILAVNQNSPLSRKSTRISIRIAD